jgi:HEAT repeat protein
VRGDAAGALSEIGAYRALTPLKAALKAETNETVRIAIEAAIGKIERMKKEITK